MPIRFYIHSDPYGYLSNFSRHPVQIYGRTWMTSEHAFQGMKTLDRDTQEFIRKQKSPGLAAYHGRNIPLRADWDNVIPSNLRITPEVRVKDVIMYEVVLAKFQQNAGIRTELLETGDAILIEAAVCDPYWGEGCSRNGLNKLGQIEMLIRTKLSV